MLGWLLGLLCMGGSSLVWALAPDRPLLDFALRRWTVDEGLPHNTIHRIVQSADGYLWLGTWEGLVRFDGRRFRVYDRANSPLLRDDGIRAMLDEPDGLLLGSSNGGLSRWRDGRIVASGYTNVSNNTQIVTLARSAADGALWIGTEDRGLLRVAADGSVLGLDRSNGLSGNWVMAFWIDPGDGTVWIGTDQGVDIWRAGELTHQAGLPVASFQALQADRQGRLWAGSSVGLFRLDPGSSQLLPLVDGVSITALLEDSGGDIWIGTSSHGLFRLGRFGLERLSAEQGLSNNRVTALFEDADGLLWIGTNGGLSQLNDAPVSVIDRRRGLSDDFVRAVTEGPDRSLWIAGSGGLDRLLDGQLETIGAAQGLRSTSLLSLLATSDKRLWIGTFDRGIDIYENGVVSPFVGNAALLSPQVRSMLTTRDGSLWIGSAGGLNRWRDGQLTAFGVAEGLPRPYVMSLHETPEGQLWVGTADGIASFDGERFHPLTRADGLPAQDIFDLTSDTDGSLWLATDGGLIRYHEGRFRALTEANGLPADTLFRVLPDASSFWLTSNVGLLRLRRRSLQALLAGSSSQLDVEQFGQIDGMGSSQCNGGTQPAGWRSRDGRLWIPTSAGLSVLDPQALDRMGTRRPGVLIESALADAQYLDAPTRLEARGSIARLTVEFTGLNFRAPSRLRYRYRLQGLDRAWIETESNAPVVYTNLAAGEYRFEVQAAIAPAGFGGGSSAQLALSIAPSWWRHPAWLLGLGLLAVLAVRGGYSWRLRQLLARERWLETEVSRRTAELRAQADHLLQLDRVREKLLAELERLARHDELTGLPNRRAGEELLRLAVDDQQSDPGSRLAIALLDLDRFKTINDRYGHPGGDAALRHLGSLLAASGYFCARMGGEEFLVILPGQDGPQAITTIEQLRRRVGQNPVDYGPVRFAIDFSAGIAVSQADETADQLFQRADQQLYAAKADGRGCVR